MIAIRVYQDELPAPISTLQRYFHEGGKTLLQAVFENTFFVSPQAVHAKTPYYPESARKSQEHYPGLEKCKVGLWQGKEVKLDDNSRAQKAWVKYSGRPIARSSGYGVRHIWGNPWDPTAFTAGWNLAYMPFWAGMLTEDQHPHPEIQRAIKQASWDLYFRNDPVCEVPAFVQDPGMDLDKLLEGTPLLILEPGGDQSLTHPTSIRRDSDPVSIVLEIRSKTNQSWANLKKAVRALQGLDHEPFGTPNVEHTAKSVVRRIARETGLDLAVLEQTFIEFALR